MSTYLSIDAVELSQDELNMVEGGTLCLIGGILGGLFGSLSYCAPKPSPCAPAPKPDPCAPKPKC
jgi:hypothetical protein